MLMTSAMTPERVFRRSLGGALIFAAAFAAGLSMPAHSAEQTDVTTLAGSMVTLYLLPFLTDEELATLRVVATNEQALSLFVTSRTGHAALAISESDGFIRDGKPAASAIALADFETAQAAREAAIAACDTARQGTENCVVVLEVGPAK
ncbi:MAG: hypothetical protein K9G71_16210 [Rhodobacteraceae bacterium]|nr:hypothetical protein [Paracoccaceae bacterium]MCF8515894.1 hypothetical protein [Paracoccaceae bacterium]MCF8520127.1 hypothetical protein [Paracoccaceae bacterium]